MTIQTLTTTTTTANRWLAEIDDRPPVAVTQEIEDAYWAERATEIEQDLLFYATARLNAAVYWHCPLTNVRFWNELDQRQQRVAKICFGRYAADSYVYKLGYDGLTVVERKALGFIEEISRKEE